MHTSGIALSVIGLVLAGLWNPAGVPAMIAAGLLSALLVGIWAVRLGFRYGARRGIEAALETMGQKN
jgi:hypothetical protein